MGSLLHPVGSEPARTYWVRRGAVVLAVVAVIAALVFVFRPQPDPVVTAEPPAATPSVTVTPTATPTESSTPTASPTPTGPLACDATNSSLSLAGYQKVAQDGKQSFRLSITNSGDATCELTLKASTFSLAVVSGKDQIWSTEHCEKWVPTASKKLKAGQAHEFSISWSVSRSAKGCRTLKSRLGPGTYVANATFAGDATARQVFVVTKAQ